MEESERPRKIRRLEPDSHSGAQHAASSAMPDNYCGRYVEGAAHDSVDKANDDHDVPNDESVSKDHLQDAFPQAEDLPGPEVVSLPPSGLMHEGQPISKSQLKKIRKKQEWDAKRDERKLIRKEKLIAKRQRKRDERNERSAHQEDAHKDPSISNGTSLKSKPQKPVTLPITIMIDCDFDDLMRDNERISLGAQVTRSYSDNKNSLYRAHLAVCSFGGKLRERFEGILAGMYKSWRGVRFLDEDFVVGAKKAKEWMSDVQGGQLQGVFSKYEAVTPEVLNRLKEDGEIVYLSSESDDTLTELKPFSTYIIGGLVDKNREKGICYKRATKAGVRTARLPIGEFMDMQSRKVLATNHVNEILLKWLETGDWGEAFFKVIPKRKGGKLKSPKEYNGAENSEQANADDPPEDVLPDEEDEQPGYKA